MHQVDAAFGQLQRFDFAQMTVRNERERIVAHTRQRGVVGGDLAQMFGAVDQEPMEAFDIELFVAGGRIDLQMDHREAGVLVVQRSQRGVRDFQQMVAIGQIRLQVVAFEKAQPVFHVAAPRDFVRHCDKVAKAAGEGEVFGRPHPGAADMFVADHAEQIAFRAHRCIEQ